MIKSKRMLFVENGSDKDIAVGVDEFSCSVNGMMVDASLSLDLVAGMKRYGEVYFSGEDLDFLNIDVIEEILLAFNVSDKESSCYLAETDFMHIKTTDYSDYVQKFDDSGFVAYEMNCLR